MRVIPTASQPAPVPGKEDVAPPLLTALEDIAMSDPGKRAIWATLKDRLLDRIEAGRQKYGVVLQTHNGRNALQDAWEESADKLFYLYQAWLEGSAVASLLEAEANSLFELTWLVAEEKAKDRALLAGAGC